MTKKCPKNDKIVMKKKPKCDQNPKSGKNKKKKGKSDQRVTEMCPKITEKLIDKLQKIYKR